MIVVSNSAPLISLSAIEKLPFLKTIWGKIHIPKSVYKEVVDFGEGRPGEQEVMNADWIETKEVKDRLAVELLRDEFDEGESETIILAKEMNADYVLIDERPACKKALYLGLSKIGTLGILLLAKEEGLIEEVKKYIDELKSKGFRMSKQVYYEVLRKAKEA